MYELEAEGAFDSAHFLTDYDGKCENLHGHRWRVVVRIAAEKLQEAGEGRGMVCDFSRLKAVVRDLCARLDHTFLVEEGSLAPETLACLRREGFSVTMLPFRTTAENLATWLASELAAQGFVVSSVEVDETPSNRAIFRP